MFKSTRWKGSRGLPEGSVLGHVPFNIITKDLDRDIKSKFIKCVYNTKLEGNLIHLLKGYIHIARKNEKFCVQVQKTEQ